jgi:hypothetical protein
MSKNNRPRTGAPLGADQPPESCHQLLFWRFGRLHASLSSASAAGGPVTHGPSKLHRVYSLQFAGQSLTSKHPSILLATFHLACAVNAYTPTILPSRGCQKFQRGLSSGQTMVSPHPFEIVSTKSRGTWLCTQQSDTSQSKCR